MAQATFDALLKVVTHSAEITVTFLALMALAVIVDCIVEQLEKRELVSPRLISILRFAAVTFLVCDLILVLVQVGTVMVQTFRPLLA
jgi:hypothetical protein